MASTATHLQLKPGMHSAALLGAAFLVAATFIGLIAQNAAFIVELGAVGALAIWCRLELAAKPRQSLRRRTMDVGAVRDHPSELRCRRRTPRNPAALSPAAARSLFREGLVTPTSGWSAGFAQANLIIVPKAQAFDVLLFAQRNPKPCPVLGVLDAGETAGPLLTGGDIRTDVPKNVVYENGVKVAEPTDIIPYWRDDLVTFIVGCSFTFEAALQENGIRVAHIDQDVNVPMYRTSVRCEPAGSIAGPLVVSMRPIPASQVADAVRITSRYPAVHGAPVHVGNPAELGISDLSKPDFGDAVEIPDGHVPVFWACGVTPQAAIMESRPSLAIGHAPGHMLITDARDSSYMVP